MSNFVRRCLVSFENGKDVNLYGHSSTVTPPNVTDPDYNQKLSEKRAELFKNAVIENIDLYMDTYAYCLIILDEEKCAISTTACCRNASGVFTVLWARVSRHS